MFKTSKAYDTLSLAKTNYVLSQCTVTYCNSLVKGKELNTGTPNTGMRKLFTVHCGRNVNKPSTPTAEVKGKGLQL